MRVIALAVIFFATTLVNGRYINAAERVRALWVVRDAITTPGGVQEVVKFAGRYGFDALFVQVRGRGDAYYRSTFVPGPEQYPTIPGQFDPLAAVIEQAHAHGIKVHAWVNMNLTASFAQPPSSPRYLYNSHPSWFMVSVAGKNMAQSPANGFDTNTIEGAYLSPVVQEVRSYLARVVGEIVTAYNVDGIHMDYIRYPGREYDFSERARNRFISLNGIDPVKLYTEGEKVDPTLALTEKWADFRAGQVDEEVRLIANRIALSGKKIALSAAVKPHIGDAYYEFGQNWPRWLKENLVDFVAPMCYYPETGTVEQVLKESLKGVDKNRVIGGIGVYKLTPAHVIEQVALMERLGLGGYCFFSYTSFRESPELIKALESIRRKP